MNGSRLNAENAHGKEYPNVENAVVCGKRAYQAHQQNHRHHVIHGCREDLDKVLQEQKIHHIHGDTRQNVRKVDGSDHFGVATEERCARCQTVYDKAAHQHRRNRVAGDAQCHHGDQRAAAHRIIGAFRCDDTLRTAGAELLRLLGGILCLIICHQRGRALTHSRQYANQRTNNRGKMLPLQQKSSNNLRDFIFKHII